MSHNDLLMAVASALVGVAAGGYVAVRLARRFLPSSAREGFPPGGKVWTHFRAAGALLFHKRWLLYLPLALVLVSCLFSAAHRLWLEIKWPRQLGPQAFRGLSEPLPIASYIRAVLGTCRVPLGG